MIVDSSALLSIVFGEQDRDIFLEAIQRALNQQHIVYVPASVIVEAGIAAEQRGYARELNTLLDTLHAEVAPLDRAIANLARQAYRQFGRGFHKARLNFGDCMSYATAVHFQLPLLYKGDDFRKTNIPSVLPIPN
jgi:ribonuclease VapC